MKMYLISDNVDTQIGMRLAGVEGCVVHTAEEVERELQAVVKRSDVGIVLLTEKLGKLVPEYIRELKLKLPTPLIVEIPDRHGSRDIADSINRHVREAIGLKL
ncbi:MAG: V-type ATP synthase subunit F [Clostridia bacterium]|nr:V-type ATP synthase subunit F [Clostridia bacterium]